jgi:hypothetical protein
MFQLIWFHANGIDAEAKARQAMAKDQATTMQAIDAIRIGLKSSDMGMKCLEEMSDAPLLRPGPTGLNRCFTLVDANQTDNPH